MTKFEIKRIKPPVEPQDFEKEVDWLIPASDHGISYGSEDGSRWDWVVSHQYKYFNHVKQFRTAIQAGGCVGLYPYLLGKKFTTVYTFEPHPTSFFCLNLNCQLPNVYKFQAALSNRCGTIDMDLVPDHVGISKVKDGSVGSTLTLSIDSFGLNDVDFICLDCEDSEAKVLAGAAETIRRCRPVITLENANHHDKKIEWMELGYREADTSKSDTILVPSEWIS